MGFFNFFTYIFLQCHRIIHQNDPSGRNMNYRYPTEIKPLVKQASESIILLESLKKVLHSCSHRFSVFWLESKATITHHPRCSKQHAGAIYAIFPDINTARSAHLHCLHSCVYGWTHQNRYLFIYAVCARKILWTLHSHALLGNMSQTTRNRQDVDPKWPLCIAKQSTLHRAQ